MDRIDEGQLPDADCGCAQSEHQNRGNIRYEQRDTIHIFDEGELDKDTTVSKMEIVVNRGFRGKVTEEVEFYSLDAIVISMVCR